MWDSGLADADLGSVENTPTIMMHEIKGSHREDAILVLDAMASAKDGSNKLILTTPQIDGKQYFIKNSDVEAELMRRSGDTAAEIWLGIDQEKYLRNLKELTDRQNSETLELLGAARGKEIYQLAIH